MQNFMWIMCYGGCVVKAIIERTMYLSLEFSFAEMNIIPSGHADGNGYLEVVSLNERSSY